MVQICIKIENKENLNELVIIELQGDLETNAGQSLANKLLGDLRFNKDGLPIIIIGHHVVFGKIVNLDKPIVVMRRVRKTDIEQMDVDNAGGDNSNESSKINTEYLVQSVIRKKILFNKRPRPIVVSELKKIK